MTMTLEILTQRVEAIEKMLATLVEEKEPKKEKKEKKEKEKKEKKEKKKKDASSSEDEKPKKKRITGYILFGNATRDEVKAELEADLNEGEKLKSTLVMKRLGEMWKALEQDERDEWNSKATEMKQQEEE